MPQGSEIPPRNTRLGRRCASKAEGLVEFSSESGVASICGAGPGRSPPDGAEGCHTRPSGREALAYVPTWPSNHPWCSGSASLGDVAKSRTSQSRQEADEQEERARNNRSFPQKCESQRVGAYMSHDEGGSAVEARTMMC